MDITGSLTIPTALFVDRHRDINAPSSSNWRTRRVGGYRLQ